MAVSWSDMSEVTRILAQIERGDSSAAEQLIPLVYDELRKLAAAKLGNEKPGQTIQATALVHDAFVRLVDQKSPQAWDNSRHFFSAAAEAMRRILIERARRRASLKRGGDRDRIELARVDPVVFPLACDDLLGLDERRRASVTEVNDLKARRNDVSKEIGRLKATGEDASARIEAMREVGARIATLDDEVREIFDRAMSREPNTLPAAPSDAHGLTLPELQDIGREVGVSPERIAHAAAELGWSGQVAPRRTLARGQAGRRGGPGQTRGPRAPAPDGSVPPGSRGLRVGKKPRAGASGADGRPGLRRGE